MNRILPPHRVKARLRGGDVALGINVRLARSPDIARIAKASGHDFIFIDTQHSIFNLESIQQIAHTALALGISPLVRVKGIDDPDVSLLLDNGVTGIVYPDISTAEQARRAVEVCRFAPLGKRGVAGGYPHFDYRGVPLTQSLPHRHASSKWRDGTASSQAAAATAAPNASSMRYAAARSFSPHRPTSGF